MIDVRDDSYTGRSPCYDCPLHLLGMDKNDCARKCQRLIAYRSGESWERRNNIVEIKDEHPMSNVEQNSLQDYLETCSRTILERDGREKTSLNSPLERGGREADGVCVICHDKDKKILNKRSETCGACYQRWVKGAVVHPTMGVFVSTQIHVKSKIPAPPGAQRCVIDGCGKVVKARGLCDTCYKKWLRGKLTHPTLGEYRFAKQPKNIKSPRAVIPAKAGHEVKQSAIQEEELKIANESLPRSMTDKITKEIIAEITTELPPADPGRIVSYLPPQGITFYLDNYPKIKKAVYDTAERNFLTPEHVIISLLGEALASREGAPARHRSRSGEAGGKVQT